MPKRPLNPLRAFIPSVMPELSRPVDSDSENDSGYDSDPYNPIPKQIRVAATELIYTIRLKPTDNAQTSFESCSTRTRVR